MPTPSWIWDQRGTQSYRNTIHKGQERALGADDLKNTNISLSPGEEKLELNLDKHLAKLSCKKK